MSKYFKVSTNKPPLSYKCGETVKFSISARENCNYTPADYVRWELRTDDGKHEKGSAVCPFTIETSLSRPGFIHLKCQAFTGEDIAISDFDILECGAGAEVEKIPLANEIPPDYDEFWQGVEDMIENFDVKLIKNELYDFAPPKGLEDYLCYSVELSTPFGAPATGYITMPPGDGTYPIQINFCGYGILPPFPGFAKDHISVVIGAHGLENGLSRFEQTNLQRVRPGYGFDETENLDPTTTYWYGMIVRDLCAAKYIKSLPQWDKKNFICNGGSQGAFQATNVAAHMKGATLLTIFVPWFCNINSENEGYIPGWRPKFSKGTSYYDTVTAATRVKCPVFITGYLGDYCCPPSSIMALYNNISSEKQLRFIQSGTHGYRPPEVEETVLYTCGDITEKNFKPGLYRHYKGGEYELMTVGVDSETLEQRIIYKALSDGRLWVRPISMWNERVFYKGEYVKRFTYIGE